MLICRAQAPSHAAAPAPSPAREESRARDAGPVFVPRRRLSPFAEKLLERARASAPPIPAATTA